MIPSLLVIRNFLSVHRLRFDFRKYSGLCLVEGINMDDDGCTSNGSGKSNIFTEAVSWCTMGESTKGYRYDEVIHNKYEKNAAVKYYFVHRGSRARIERYRKHDKYGDIVRFFVDGENRTRSRTEDTNKEIMKFLGITKDIFFYAFILGQGLTYRFSKLSDPKKKGMLEDISGSGIFDQGLKRVDDSLSQLDVLIRQRTVMIDRFKEDLEREKKNAKESEDYLKKVEDEYKEERKNREQKIEDLRLKVVLSKELLQKSKDELSVLEDKYDATTNRLLGVQKKYGSVEGRLEEAETNIKRLESFKKRCPFCGSVVEDKALLLGNYKDRVKMLQGDLDVLLEDVRKLESEDREMKSALRRVESEVTGYRKDIDSLNEEIKMLKKQPDQTDTLSLCRDRHKELEGRVQVGKSRVINERREKKKLEEDKEYYKFWDTAFTDLRRTTLSTYIRYLNKRAKLYSEILTGKPLINLTARSATKKGKPVERMGMKVYTQGGEYDKSSGGEKDRMDVSLAFALNDMVKHMTGFDCNFLVADEPAVYLDELGIERFGQILRDRTKGGVVFLISQNPVFKNLSDKVITVVKDGGVSKVRE